MFNIISPNKLVGASTVRFWKKQQVQEVPWDILIIEEVGKYWRTPRSTVGWVITSQLLRSRSKSWRCGYAGQADTPFQPLYIACNKSVEQSALFFGLIVWVTVMERQDDWYFKPADKEAEDIIGMTYFHRTLKK